MIDKKEMAKRNREYMKSLSPEALAELKQNRIYDKQRRDDEKQEKLRIKEQKVNCKRELQVLNFMLKHDVLFHHHGRQDSMKETIEKQIETLKRTGKHTEYHPYIWNRWGEGKNYMPLCLLDGNIFSSREFNSIYDVPLDGSYMFHIYDSGERGLGSFHRITAEKVGTFKKIPHVDPGAMVPIVAD